jgi:hypothetical protein
MPSGRRMTIKNRPSKTKDQPLAALSNPNKGIERRRLLKLLTPLVELRSDSELQALMKEDDAPIKAFKPKRVKIRHN